LRKTEPSTRSKKRFEFRNQGGLGGSTNRLIYDRSVFKKEQGGDGVDAVPSGERLAVVYVDFANFGLAGLGGGNFINYRTEHPAGTAPRRPKVDENRYGRVEYLGLEIGFVDGEYVFVSHKEKGLKNERELHLGF
jgi:hypothetical protein